MAQHTSTGCQGCIDLAKKIEELEGRISTLHQIQKSEKFLDSVITFGPTQDTGEMDSTVPQTINCDVTSNNPKSSSPKITDHWIHLGAKPKASKMSHGIQNNPGSLGSGYEGNKSSSLPCEIKLTNRYSVLSSDDFPPLGRPIDSDPTQGPFPSLSESARTDVATPGQSNRRATKVGKLVFTPAPGTRPAEVCTSDPRVLNQSGTNTLLPPRIHNRVSPNTALAESNLSGSNMQRPQRNVGPTLIIGDSIIRNVRSESAKCYCFPGAKVKALVEKCMDLLPQHPSSKNVIIHVGANDILDEKSKILKRDFTGLLNVLESYGKRLFISGPIPPFGRGMSRFSRTLSFHTWLQSTCAARKVLFVDNFNLFWNRRSFYRSDGIHPNSLGVRVLTDNLFYVVSTSSL